MRALGRLQGFVASSNTARSACVGKSELASIVRHHAAVAGSFTRVIVSPILSSPTFGRHSRALGSPAARNANGTLPTRTACTKAVAGPVASTRLTASPEARG
jgi:hypothetical protein